MSSQEGKPTSGHPVMLRILRWLMEEKGRTLPDPDDEDGVQELALAVGKSPDVIRTLLVQSTGDGPGADTLKILR